MDKTASGSVKVTGRTRDLMIFVDKLAYHFTRHWGAFVNFMLFLFVAPFFLAPLLMNSGHERTGRLLYRLYQPACHQLPERSFFLGGEKLVYSREELVQAGMDPMHLPYERRHFLGTPDIGYKTVVCQRDVAIYVGLLILGMIYMISARNWLQPQSFWFFLAFLAPMAVDGITQGLGLRESSAVMRVVTGLSVASGSVLILYPYIDEAMRDLRDEVARKLNLEGGSG